jgi:1-acyl-sn-glycerol-3-phosphate acyltransferase
MTRSVRAGGRIATASAHRALRSVRRGFPYTAPTTPAGVERLDPEPTLGQHYDTEWARRFPARWGRAVILESIVRPAVAALASPDRVGTDRLDGLGDRPVIFAANHHSHLDSPVLLSSIPEPWRYKMFVGAAADYFFRTRVTAAASALVIGAIPIERTKVTRRSADQASALIGDGWSMLIFPEGGRSPDGWGQRFRGGAAYLSSRTGAPVVPVHIEGTGRILRKGSKMLTPAHTKVTFGSPLHPQDGESANRMAERIEQAVAELADEATTDWWAARQRAASGATPALSGPAAPAWRRAWALGDRGPRRRQKTRWPEL